MLTLAWPEIERKYNIDMLIIDVLNIFASLIYLLFSVKWGE